MATRNSKRHVIDVCGLQHALFPPCLWHFTTWNNPHLLSGCNLFCSNVHRYIHNTYSHSDKWEGMGDVGSARYEPALLPKCATIRVLSYSECWRSSSRMHTQDLLGKESSNDGCDTMLSGCPYRCPHCHDMDSHHTDLIDCILVIFRVCRCSSPAIVIYWT